MNTALNQWYLAEVVEAQALYAQLNEKMKNVLSYRAVSLDKQEQAGIAQDMLVRYEIELDKLKQMTTGELKC